MVFDPSNNGDDGEDKYKKAEYNKKTRSFSPQKSFNGILGEKTQANHKLLGLL